MGMRTGTRGWLAAVAAAGWLCLAPPGLWGQEKVAGKEAGERGFTPTGSYQLSEIETVNSKNGNVVLVVPLASLPPGRGGNPGFELTLNYNSGLRDLLARNVWNAERDAVQGDPHYIERQEVGEAFGSPGWRYNYDYRLDVQDRNSYRSANHPLHCEPAADIPERLRDFPSKHWHRYQVRMVFPDGSVHEFRPEGEDDVHGDGYFRIYPTGWKLKERAQCLSEAERWIAPDRSRMVTYYSIDGTYLRLDFEPDPASVIAGTDAVRKWQDNPWTLTFPDGRQVTGVGLMADGFLDPNDSNADAVTVDISRQLDREYDPYDLITDEVGRTIRIEPASEENPDRQTIRQEGAGGEELTWTVHWGDTRVNRTYAIKRIQRNDGGEIHTATLQDEVGNIEGDLRMVKRIVLPSELGGLDYEFTYNGTESNPPRAAYAPHSRGLGELRTATMPWGATATYTYVQDYEHTETASMVYKAQAVAENAITAKSVTYPTGFGSGTLTEAWDYQIAPNSQAIITTPGGGKTRETYSGNPGQLGLLVKVEHCEEATIPLGGTNCLDSKVSRVIEREWAYNIPAIGSPGITRASIFRANPYVKSEYRTEHGTADKTAATDYSYDKNGNLTQVNEYDWVDYSSVHDADGNPTASRGTRRRTTVHTYQAATPAATDTTTSDDDAYYDPDSARRLRLRASTEIRDGGGTKRSRREFSYDSRGNLTGEKIGKSNSSGVVSGTLTSTNSFTITYTYDTHSNRLTTTDGEGNLTRWTYGAITGSGSPTISHLYPTRVEEAADEEGVERTTTYGYDFHTGEVTSATDADNGVTTTTELDDVGRAIVVKEADGTEQERWTQSWYCDEKRRMIVRTDLGGDEGDGELVAVTDYDGLGRERLVRSYEGDAPSLPASSNRNAHCSAYDSETAGIKVATHYERSGTSSYTTTSNPYRGTAKSGWTRTRLDHLGRMVEIGHFSGATKPSTSASPTLGTTTTAYDAEYTTVTDPANKKRRSKRDGLGRLVRVDEPDSSDTLGTAGSPNQATSYSYNALDNLTRVTQGAQTRTFVYDSLSRLISASNPENRASATAASVTYTYDNNGNLTGRTDARGVAVSYSYDALDRPTGRSYSYAGSEAAVSLGTTRVDYAYDSCGSYSRGRLCSVTAEKDGRAVSKTAYNRYDALGRVLESAQTTGGTSYTMAYNYDRAGNLIAQRYPSGRVINTVYDGAGRAGGVKRGEDWYAGGEGSDAVGYEPHGGVRQLLLGNGVWEQRRHNVRLQPTQIGLGTAKTPGSLTAAGSGLLLLDYAYGASSNNGNLLSQRIRAGTLDVTQSYGYDELNRLIEATEEAGGTETWSQDYGYDRYGNRRVTGGAAHGANQALTPQATMDIDTGTNRLSGSNGVNTIGYDAAGNLTADWAGRTFTYDGDNRMVAFDEPMGTDQDTAYVYDGEGRRVQKVVGGASGITTTYVYNITGQLLAEYGGTAPEAPGTRYLTPAHLGSTRVVTGADVTGASQGVLTRHDYLPFGEEIGAALGGRDQIDGYTASRLDGPTQKFTGKERDNESGLDYFNARYFSGAGGRFTSIDPENAGADPEDPQTWNAYAYVGNNPLNLVDPDGKAAGAAIAACVAHPGCRGAAGAVVGAGVSVFTYAVGNFFTGGEVTWSGVVGAATRGAITGGSAALTGTVVNPGTAAVIGAGANVIGGEADRTISGQETETSDVLADFVVGAGGLVPSSAGSHVAKQITQKAFDTAEQAATTASSVFSGYGKQMINEVKTNQARQNVVGYVAGEGVTNVTGTVTSSVVKATSRVAAPQCAPDANGNSMCN